jgi:hypothetical protein
MAFRRISNMSDAERKELENKYMASAAELFAKKSFDGERRPTPPKFDSVGDFVDVLLDKEPVREQQKEVGGSWEPMYLEKGPSGWKPKKESELTEGRDNFPLMQIVVEGVNLATGERTTLYFNNKAKMEALEAAMDKTDLTIGNAVRMKRMPNNGKQYGWEVKIAAPKG